MMNKNRGALMKVIFLFVIGLSFMSHASQVTVVSEYVDNPQVVGKKMFSYLFWDVYEASLLAPNGKYDASKPFALMLNYQRNLDGKKIAERSITEMEKQGVNDKSKLDEWLTIMTDIFPDVSEGDVITGIATQENKSLFYLNGTLIGTVDDKTFPDHFFAIWLSEKTSEPALRRALLGNN